MSHNAPVHAYKSVYAFEIVRGSFPLKHCRVSVIAVVLLIMRYCAYFFFYWKCAVRSIFLRCYR